MDRGWDDLLKRLEALEEKQTQTVAGWRRIWTPLYVVGLTFLSNLGIWVLKSP